VQITDSDKEVLSISALLARVSLLFANPFQLFAKFNHQKINSGASSHTFGSA